MGLDTPIIDLSQIASTARAGQAERAIALPYSSTSIER